MKKWDNVVLIFSLLIRIIAGLLILLSGKFHSEEKILFNGASAKVKKIGSSFVSFSLLLLIKLIVIYC